MKSKIINYLNVIISIPLVLLATVLIGLGIGFMHAQISGLATISTLETLIVSVVLIVLGILLLVNAILFIKLYSKKKEKSKY